MTDQPGLVYVIHLEAPLAHARHYVGWTASPWNLRLRISHHRAGCGSRMLAAVNRAGIRWAVVEVSSGTRTDERHRKNRKDATRTCPACRGHLHVCFGCGRLYKRPANLARHQLTKGCS